MTVTVGPSIALASLGLYLDAANPNSYPGSGTSWSDLSLNHFSFFLNNAPSWFNIQMGYFQFGTSQSAVCNPINTFLLSSGLTVSTWCKVSSGNTDRTIISHSSAENVDDGWKMIVTNMGTFAFYVDGTLLDSSIPVVGNQWVNLTVTTTNTQLAYFINGSQVSSSNSLPALSSVPVCCLVGNDPSNNSLLGQIATVSISNQVLSDVEIEQNFDALRGRFGV